MKLMLAFFLLAAAVRLLADVKVETVEYKQGDTVCEGYFAYDDAQTTARPGVIVVHDWMGNGEFSKKKAEDLAKLGYTAFAADIYGKGERPKDMKEAAQYAGKFKNDRALLRARINAALNTFKQFPKVDAKHIAVMGFCFGGTTALELARSGADIVGVVSFHGGLSTPTPADAKNIKCKVLILHGADDPFVKPEEVAAFKKEMDDAKVDYKFIAYPGAVHGFTNPAAGSDNSKGMAYNENADKLSWAAMKGFFEQVMK
ncbi:MAG TPA: dienelactone hydrolase family protein [Planctomycetota bacterium]|nr:dienelactone hydrolase family protein [Planctomycetota bacterium]